jgi:hypothetical protein
MADAFEILAHDHAEVKQMLIHLELGAIRRGDAAAGKARDSITHRGAN